MIKFHIITRVSKALRKSDAPASMAGCYALIAVLLICIAVWAVNQ